MIIIKVKINELLTTIYAVAMFLMLSIAAYNLVPVVYYVKGIGYTVFVVVLFVFAYMAYVAGLIKERRRL